MDMKKQKGCWRFPVTAPPLEGLRLDVRLLSFRYNMSLDQRAAAALPGEHRNRSGVTVTGRVHDVY